MRVAIVIPPVRDFYFTPHRASFLGVHTIAGILRGSGIECRIFNAVRARGRPQPLPEELSYLSKYLGREFFFKSYQRFGILPGHLAEELRRYGPDRVFVSCFAFCYACEAIETIDAIKHELPGIDIVVGGSGATCNPEYFLGNSRADFVAVGEADDIAVDIAEGPGSCERLVCGGRSGESCTPTSPEFRPVLVKTGETKNSVYFSTMISRGCPRRCAFCSVHRIFPSYRRAALEDVQEMFRALSPCAKRVHVNFEDDNATLDFEYFQKILEMLRCRTGGRAGFSMENGVEFATLDESKIRIMKEYGLVKLNLPLVSLNRDVLRAAGRACAPDLFKDIVDACSSLAIPVTAYLIAGLPGESYASVMEAIDFLSGLPVIIGISPFYPVPGIRGYEDSSLFNRLSPRLCSGMSFRQWNECTTEQLVKIFMRCREISLKRLRERPTALDALG